MSSTSIRIGIDCTAPCSAGGRPTPGARCSRGFFRALFKSHLGGRAPQQLGIVVPVVPLGRRPAVPQNPLQHQLTDSPSLAQCREAVPEGVAMNGAIESGRDARAHDGALQGAIEDMVPSHAPSLRAARQLARRKHELPFECLGRAGVLAFQSVRQLDASEIESQTSAMASPPSLHRGQKRPGPNRAILRPASSQTSAPISMGTEK